MANIYIPSYLRT